MLCMLKKTMRIYFMFLPVIFRPIQWQVALAPNMSRVAAVQSGQLTIHTYANYHSESGCEEGKDEHEAGERHLELPLRFRRIPQSRILSWCPLSRYLLLFSGGSEEEGADILVLDTEKGELLGTLSTVALLSSFANVRSTRCVHLFCMDMAEDTSRDDLSSDYLFCLCLVSAAGDLVALSCSLRSLSDELTTGIPANDKLMDSRHDLRHEIACVIMATSDDCVNIEQGCVEVDAVAWLPRHRSVLLTVAVATMSSAPDGGVEKVVQLQFWNYQLIRKNKGLNQGAEKMQWQWRQSQAPLNVVRSAQGRALSLSSNNGETKVLLLLSSGQLLGLQLEEGKVDGVGIINIAGYFPVQCDSVTQSWCHQGSDGEGDSTDIITAAHYLSEDSLLLVARGGAVAVGRLCSPGCREEGEDWYLQRCAVDTLPPDLGLCGSHSILVPPMPVSMSQCELACNGGVLARISLLRAVDSWSCQVI